MAMTIVLEVMLLEGRYYGMSERSERGTLYRPCHGHENYRQDYSHDY